MIIKLNGKVVPSYDITERDGEILLDINTQYLRERYGHASTSQRRGFLVGWLRRKFTDSTRKTVEAVVDAHPEMFDHKTTQEERNRLVFDMEASIR